MTMQDPISDLITQLRNGYLAKKDTIIIYMSKTKLAIIQILKKEYFINDYKIIDYSTNIKKIEIYLKYYGKKIPIMKKISRVSKPSIRIYYKNKNIPIISNGFGITILSTSHGIITNKEAKEKNTGGEILCTVE